MSHIFFNLYGCSQFNQFILDKFNFTEGDCQFHHFPDGETIVKLNSSIAGKDLLFIIDFSNPNAKLLPLIIAAETARDLGAKKVHLFSPYLPYMRQDKQFHVNEGITSRYFAKLISEYFDSLLTIEPHLHRWHSLNDIYRIPVTALSASLPIAVWLKEHTKKPLLIGPDRESEQWVSQVAKLVNAPYVVFDKIRHGDQEVEISSPSLTSFSGCYPVIIDDVISTGRTMSKILQYLKHNHFDKMTCIGVHALFVGDAYEQLKIQGASDVITCNTLSHVTNQIDVSTVISDYLAKNFKGS